MCPDLTGRAGTRAMQARESSEKEGPKIALLVDGCSVIRWLAVCPPAPPRPAARSARVDAPAMRNATLRNPASLRHCRCAARFVRVPPSCRSVPRRAAAGQRRSMSCSIQTTLATRDEDGPFASDRCSPAGLCPVHAAHAPPASHHLPSWARAATTNALDCMPAASRSGKAEQSAGSEQRARANYGTRPLTRCDIPPNIPPSQFPPHLRPER